MSPVNPSSETAFTGTLFEFDVTLIPVKPGDVVEPRLGRPQSDEPPEIRRPE